MASPSFRERESNAMQCAREVNDGTRIEIASESGEREKKNEEKKIETVSLLFVLINFSCPSCVLFGLCRRRNTN